MTVRTPAGTHLSIHEAALIDYAAFVLDQRRDRVFQTNLTPWSDGIRVKTSAPFQTPWRTIQLAEDAVGLLNSSLILNLNEPNALGDVSWVKPGKYVGIWWAMHIRKRTWGSGPIHGATTEETKRYMDFAAKYGFDGVLVEGWNVGWDGDWFHNGDLFSFTEPYPDFDIRAVGEYGRKVGVRLIGHHETSGNVTNYARQMDAAFDLYESVGVRQVKTGYVADGGNIKRVDENGDGALRMARRPVHGRGNTCVGDRGGQAQDQHQHARADQGHRFATHLPELDFPGRRPRPGVQRLGRRRPTRLSTRRCWPIRALLAGPMDFTPGIFDLTPFGMESPHRVQTTLAKQLALYVVIYSPIQMAADLPENYEARPDASPVHRRCADRLGGEHRAGRRSGRLCRDRAAGAWRRRLVSRRGRPTRSCARSKMPLDFLDDGRRYTAQIYRDGYHANWKTNPYALEIEQRELRRDGVLTLRLAPGGGAAVRFRAETGA